MATTVIYQHPLAYLLGLEGIALLRAFAGEYDRDFTDARLAETRELLDSVQQLGSGVAVNPISTMDGYRDWAPFYDLPGNQLIELEQPIVRQILHGLPAGVALDAACGTGRHAEYLASLGHQVIGVDSSPEMLARARAKIPAGKFHEADMHHLPVPDDHVDLVICALSLTHVPELAPVLAEIVRVLRPGGHLVISDSRGLIHDIGLPLVTIGPDGQPGYMPTWTRLTSDYLVAALPLGLHVRRCEEPRVPYPLVDHTGTPPADTDPVPAHVPDTRLTSGPCIPGRQTPPTPPTAANPPPSFGTSNSPAPEPAPTVVNHQVEVELLRPRSSGHCGGWYPSTAVNSIVATPSLTAE